MILASKVKARGLGFSVLVRAVSVLGLKHQFCCILFLGTEILYKHSLKKYVNRQSVHECLYRQICVCVSPVFGKPTQKFYTLTFEQDFILKHIPQPQCYCSQESFQKYSKLQFKYVWTKSANYCSQEQKAQQLRIPISLAELSPPCHSQVLTPLLPESLRSITGFRI